MIESLNWKKGFFSDTYRIYANKQQIGKLKNKTFSQTSVGEIKGKKYTFKTKGFFKQQTEIIDNSDNSVIGKITYNNWMSKASLSIRNKQFSWKYENFWNTKWSLNDSDGVQINYKGSSKSGQINSKTDNDLLLLTGLYVTNYYWQMTIVIIMVVLVPIWAS
jgi:hypothetical protein